MSPLTAAVRGAFAALALLAFAGGSEAQAALESRKDAPEITKAREALGLFLRRGQQQPHAGEQVTRLLRGRVRETRQMVKHAGPGRTRMEYLSPPNLSGETILIVGGRFFHYKPSPENKILEGVAPPGELAERARELQQRLRRGAIQARVVGNEQVAGREASIVEIRPVRPVAPYLKFWIDSSTGVRLKYQSLDASGRVASETYFTRVDYQPDFTATDFQPSSLPNVPHEPLLPKKPPLATVSAAQAQAPYTIREPSVPEGFRLNGVWVVPGGNRRHTTILRYTDGVNSFALFQSPAGGNRPIRAGGRLPRFRNGVAQWTANGMGYILIGNLKPESVSTISESLGVR